jgi:hypothetical protein
VTGEQDRNILSVIRTAPLQRLHAEWRRLRGDRSLPPYGAFDPLRLPQLLGRLSVIAIERDPPRFRYRVFSTRAAEALGVEMTGRHVHDMPDDEERTVALDRLMRCLDDPRPTVIVRSARGRINFVTFESLLLPFGEDGTTVDTVIFGLSSLHKQAAWQYDGALPAVLSEHVVEDG